MVHSALKRKRYSVESGTESSPSEFSDFHQESIVSNPLLTPLRPPNPVPHPAPPPPSHDPRPSLKILLDLMTPAEFAKLLRARIDRLLATWPPTSQSQPTNFLPSPTSSSSSSSSQFKDPQEALHPGPTAIRAFVAFFRLEDVHTPFSFTLPELHTHLLALQTLLSFLTSRELKEIVKARLNAEGDEQERWMVVQGVLDVMRNAGTEDEGDVDVEMGAVGVEPRSHEGGISSGATDVSNNETVSGSAASSLGNYSAIEAERDDTNPAPTTPDKGSVHGAISSHKEPPETSTSVSSGVEPLISASSLAANTGADVAPSSDASPTTASDPAIPEKTAICDQTNSTVPTVSAAIDGPAAPSPIPVQDADTDVDMDMSDDGEADCGLLVTVLGSQNEGSSDDQDKTSKADKIQKPVPLEDSHETLVKQAPDTPKEFDKSDRSRREGARNGPLPRLTITLPPLSRKTFASAAPLPQDGTPSPSSNEPAGKRRRINRASKYTPIPTPVSATSSVPPAREDQVSPRLPPTPVRALENPTPPRLSPPAVSLIRPAPRFVPARFTSSHIVPAIVANAIVAPPAPVEPPASQIQCKSSQASSSEEIVAIKQEIGESLHAEQEQKEKELIKQSKLDHQGSASSPIVISDTPTFSTPGRISDASPSKPSPPSPVPRTVVPSAPRAIASVAGGTRSIFVAPTGDPIGQTSLPADSPRTLRPEGPEPPPPFEAKPIAPPSQVGVPQGKSLQVNTSVKRSSFPVRRGRSRSRSESTRSGRSESDSRSTSRRRSSRHDNQGTRHRLPRRPTSPSPMRRRRTSAAYSTSRSRSRRRSRSGSRTRRYRSRRSISPTDTPSRSSSPAYRRRKYSYSRPPSPSSARRESPARNALNERHWSPGDERKHRGRRFDKRSRSPTPSRMFPDHWSPRMNGQSRRVNGPNRVRKDKGYEKMSGGGDVLARPMTNRQRSSSRGSWSRT